MDINALNNFKKYINRKNSAHKAIYKKLILSSSGEKSINFFRLSAKNVAMKVYYILEHPRPKPRYYITIPTYIAGFLKRILSSSIIDKVISKFI